MPSEARAASGDASMSLEPMPSTVDASGAVRAAQAVSWVVAALTAGALGLLCFARTNVTVSGEVTLVPTRESAPLQSVATGRVAEVLVADGDRLSPGAPLVRLDAEEIVASLRALEGEREAARARSSALEQLVAEHEVSAGLDSVARAEGLRVADYELRETHEAVEAAARDAELRARELSRTRALEATGAVAASEHDRVAGDAVRAAGAHAQARAREQRHAAERRRAGAERVHAQSTDRARVLEARVDLALARERIAALDDEIASARAKLDERTISSTRGGVVQGLRVRAPGTVLKAGEVVAWVVPERDPLLAEVRIPPSAVGFVAPGQKVVLKLDPYPFRDFGTLDGVVQWVSLDAAHTSEGLAREAYHVARVRIDHVPDDETGAALALSPGMHGSAELVLWRSRILVALLQPFRGSLSSVPK